MLELVENLEQLVAPVNGPEHVLGNLVVEGRQRREEPPAQERHLFVQIQPFPEDLEQMPCHIALVGAQQCFYVLVAAQQGAFRDVHDQGHFLARKP